MEHGQREDSTHRKLSVELVAVLNPKNDGTKSIVCKPKIYQDGDISS